MQCVDSVDMIAESALESIDDSAQDESVLNESDYR